ncbi:Septum site-determining protein MinD [Hydrogenovibrio crunogenus]|uniref:Septum site-determining protein MinD n=1 Tax=Hydrogenovibrio crunogenus TaxID=39765 RepID=A0A4P7P145_9GAMM|nr:AAA family ATPase [Hydrogenovibrio crunogenus]QBZ83758.1 Septum site-determining protein MinD [Hydrogenovibrio crunogenus]
MSQQINSTSIALKQAVYIGQDDDLLEAVRVSIVSKYELEEMKDIPHIWPDDIDLVLMEFDGEVNQTLERINQILTLSKGVNLYVLLKNKDADFIIEANHQGVQGFIECPNEVFHILSILHMQDRRRKGKNGNVSSFFSLKGGVGCTALATNIASELSEMTENRTVLVDLNMPLGDTSLYLNMEGERLYTLTDFVYNLNRFDENLIYKSLSQHQSGLYLLSLPSEMGELDNLNADLIKTIIQSLRKYFDHVVIDCSSDLSDVTLSCLDESDNIVLVAEPSLSSLRAVNTVIKLTQRLGYLKESLKLIINRDHSNQDEMMEEIIGVMDVDRTVRVYNDYQSFNGSLKEGQLLKAFSQDAKVNQQLHAIANMLHNGSFQMESVSTQPQKPAFQFLHECQRVLTKLLKKVKPEEAKTA